MRARAVEGEHSDDDGAVVFGVPLGKGAFVLQPLVPGSYRVEVDDGVNPPHFIDGSRSGVLRLRAGERREAVATLACAAELSGVVSDAQGWPMADAWVTIKPEADVDEEFAEGRLSPKARILAGEDGRFAFEGVCATGRYRLTAEHPEGGAVVVRHVDVGTNHRLTLLEPGTVVGGVVFSDGAPVENFALSLRHFALGTTRLEQVHSRDGFFEVQGFPAGEVELQAHSAGLTSYAQLTVPPGGASARLRLTLQEPGQ